MNGIDFLADTNFLINIHEGQEIVEPFLEYNYAVSFITEIELLGRFSISKSEKELIKSLLQEFLVIEMNTHIKERCIWLKQRYKIKSPDAIIASTAIELNLPLLSSDSVFSNIKTLDFVYLEKK